MLSAPEISAILFVIGFALLVYVMSATKDSQ